MSVIVKILTVLAFAVITANGLAGKASAALAGHEPDIRVGSFGASASAAWEGDILGKWDLPVDPGNVATKIVGGNKGLTLPFVAEVGHVYRASVDVNPDGPTKDQWFGLGFAADSGWNDDTMHYPGASGLEWLSKGGEASTSVGPGYHNVTDPGLINVTSPKTLTVILDTATDPTNWSFAFEFSNTDGSNSQVLRPAASYGGVPLINDVGISGDFSSRGTYDNFKLTVDQGTVLYFDTFTSPIKPGDFDNDGDVDGQDFLVWQRGGSPNPTSADDLTLWKNHFGLGGSGVAAAPEPSTGVLLAIAGLALLRRAPK